MNKNKHLTILYPAGENMYSKKDFSPEFSEEQISMISAIEIQPFDGRNTAKIPSKTTHLIMHFLDRLDENDFKRLPNLCYVGTCSTGWWDKYFDINYMKQQNIALDINGTYAQNSVAEGVFAALLSYVRQTPDIMTKTWDAKIASGIELFGKKIGIVGMGRIGTRVKKIATGFEMKVLYAGRKEAHGTINVTYDELLSLSDIITFHVPKSSGLLLTKDNIHLLKPTSILINSSGFELLNIEALKQFLVNNPDAKYIHLAMPDEAIYKILSHLPNVVLYPLFTCYTKEADLNRKIVPIDNLKAFLNGQSTPNRII